MATIGGMGQVGVVAMGLTYRDAVRLLGASDTRVVDALDRLAGGLLLAASATGTGFALSLFDVKGEFARLGAGLVGTLGDRLRGLGRFERSERLAAAHAVLVVSAYFEILGKTDLPFDVRKLELEGPEQVALAGGASGRSNRLAVLASGLLQADVPMPAPQWPYGRCCIRRAQRPERLLRCQLAVASVLPARLRRRSPGTGSRRR